jgi:hypothetical protein
VTYIAQPKFHRPGLKKNELGSTHRNYDSGAGQIHRQPAVIICRAEATA